MRADIEKIVEKRNKQLEAANIEAIKGYIRNMTEKEKSEIVKLCSTETLLGEIDRRSKVTARQLNQIREILGTRQLWEAQDV